MIDLKEQILDILYPITYELKNIIYWFKYRFHPKYWQYWLIKPKTLGIGYYDPDTLMLHSCMHLLVEFFEYQLDRSHVEWFHDDDHAHAFKEMKAIYEWWTIERVELERKIDNDYSDESKYSYDETHYFSNILHHREQEMLHRLINIRRFMWD
jgi:hypothetical protein